MATPTVATTTLFVYGTLKRGQRNHRLIADQEFLGEVVTEPRYRVFDLGPHPGLVTDLVTGLSVKGELWAVSACCLAELDDFETGEGLWARFPVAVAGRGGAEAYFWIGKVPMDVRSGDVWPFPSAERRVRSTE